MVNLLCFCTLQAWSEHLNFIKTRSVLLCVLKPLIWKKVDFVQQLKISWPMLFYQVNIITLTILQTLTFLCIVMEIRCQTRIFMNNNFCRLSNREKKLLKQNDLIKSGMLIVGVAKFLSCEKTLVKNPSKTFGPSIMSNKKQSARCVLKSKNVSAFGCRSLKM